MKFVWSRLSSREEDLKWNWALSLYDKYAQHKNSLLRGYEIYNFACKTLPSSFFFSDVRSAVERIFKETAFSSYINTYGHDLAQESLSKGSWNYLFGRPFFGPHSYHLSLSDLCPGVENVFKEIMHLHCKTCMTKPNHKNPCPRGSDNL